MKKYIPLLLLLLLLSCDRIFHEEDTQYIVPETKQEKIDLVNGMYSRLVKVHNEDYFKALIRSDDVNVYFDYDFYFTVLISANITNTYYCSEAFGGSIDFHKTIGNIYMNLYKLIITANSLIPKLNGEEDKALKGELHFLRAYSYFKLARLFGTPPLITDIDVKFTIQKPGFKDFYELIEKDLLMALELLPDNYTKVRIPGETPHRGTAKALLAEVYLAWAGFPVNDQSKYAQAARLSGEVIEQAEYYNFELIPDLADLWNVQNRHNRENIFGLFFKTNYKLGPDDFAVRLVEETENNINVNFWDDSKGELPVHNYKPEFKFYANFPDNYRKYCYYPLLQSYLDWDPKTKSYVHLKVDPIKDPCAFLYAVFCYKWIDQKPAKKQGHPFNRGSQATLYLLRYAQTLLTYAEACARSGKLDESAFEAVNMVRRRANKLDIHTPCEFDLPKNLTAGQFLDAVVWERAWELSFEPEGRWFDIVRLELKDKISSFGQDVQYKVPLEYLTDDWYFYKVPIEDRQINPNFE